jgi:TRAP-type C4-dicarboxylate transport system permease small subunit
MLAASFAQVLNRNIFQLPIGWLEELARYSQVYLALLAMELGLRDGSQMSLTMLTDIMPARARKIIELIAKGVVVAFSLILCVQSIELYQNQLLPDSNPRV